MFLDNRYPCFENFASTIPTDGTVKLIFTTIEIVELIFLKFSHLLVQSRNITVDKRQCVVKSRHTKKF